MLYYYLLQLLLVDVPSTDNTEEHPIASSNTDDKTPPSSAHG